MKTTTHNALAVKRILRPQDYKRDPNCQVMNRKTGEMVSVPVELIQALRAGLLTVK